ncbi:hypothetical protein BASA50_007098 [Batrachochytrium salamandrivorans]|uniref:Bromo domain-containing protein n=1 Tax=Batrachochytrium salamandrivorans TaxID=1357716 RepID=A0ABQ8F8L9_9FUNG|nr:hypothetical protein BASA50_007098 [Batrachochytrium salamandrivorans]
MATTANTAMVVPQQQQQQPQKQQVSRPLIQEQEPQTLQELPVVVQPLLQQQDHLLVETAAPQGGVGVVAGGEAAVLLQQQQSIPLPDMDPTLNPTTFFSLVQEQQQQQQQQPLLHQQNTNMPFLLSTPTVNDTPIAPAVAHQFLQASGLVGAVGVSDGSTFEPLHTKSVTTSAPAQSFTNGQNAISSVDTVNIGSDMIAGGAPSAFSSMGGDQLLHRHSVDFSTTRSLSDMSLSSEQAVHNNHHTPSATSIADDASIQDGSLGHPNDGGSVYDRDNDDRDYAMGRSSSISSTKLHLPDENPVSGTNSLNSLTSDSALLLIDQLKWFGGVTRNMKKRKDAIIFLVPVDPVALNIPTYFTVIKHPMDISTIEKKLQARSYADIAAVKSDFETMFNNCYLFNGHDAQVSVMARNLYNWYVKELEKLPLTPRPPVDRKPKQPHRESISGVDHRPRRESHTPSRDPTPDNKRFKLKKTSSELKFCSHIQRELCKKHHSPYNLPFLVPVDPISLGIPQYRSIITRPMDLSTMRKKLDAGDYDNASEFEADMRLLLNNCYTFNPPGTDVYNLGKRLESAFNVKWAEKAVFLAQHSEPASKQSKPKQIPPSSTPQPAVSARPAARPPTHATPTPPAVNKSVPTSTPVPAKPPVAAKAPLQTAQHEQAKAQRPQKQTKPPPPVQAATPVSANGGTIASRSSRPPAKAAPPSDSESSSEEDADSQHIEMLQTQLNLLNTQLQMLTDKRNKKRKRKAAHANSNSMAAAAATTPAPSSAVERTPFQPPATTTAAPSTSKPRAPRSRPTAPKSDRKRPAKKRPRSNDSDGENEPDEISYDQKRELSESIDLLPQERLSTVLEIIKENALLNTTGEEEIVLDIDSLDKSVLWKLYVFVRKHTRSIAKPIAPPVAEVPRPAALENSAFQSVTNASSIAPVGTVAVGTPPGPLATVPIKQGSESSSSSGSDSDGSDIFSDEETEGDVVSQNATSSTGRRQASYTRTRSASMSHSVRDISSDGGDINEPGVTCQDITAPSSNIDDTQTHKSTPFLTIKNPFISDRGAAPADTTPQPTLSADNPQISPPTVTESSAATKKSDAPFRTEKGDVTAWGSVSTGIGGISSLPGKFTQHHSFMQKKAATGFYSKGANVGLSRRASSFNHSGTGGSTQVKDEVSAVPVPKKPRYDSVLDSAWDHHKTLTNPEKEVDKRRKPIEEVEKVEEEKTDSANATTGIAQVGKAAGLRTATSVDKDLAANSDTDAVRTSGKRNTLDARSNNDDHDVNQRRILSEKWMIQQHDAAEVAASRERDILDRQKQYAQLTLIDLQGPGDLINSFSVSMDNMEAFLGESKAIRDVFRKEAVDEVGRVVGPWAFQCELSSSGEDDDEDEDDEVDISASENAGRHMGVDDRRENIDEPALLFESNAVESDQHEETDMELD